MFPNSKKNYTILMFILFLGFPSEWLWSQYTISGASSVTEGSSHTYSISPTNSISSTTWSLFKDSSVNASYTSQNNTSATVNFVDGGTTNSLGVVANIFDTGSNFHFANKAVTINPPAPPPNPGNPTVSNNNCGNATLTRSGSPPSGVTWYWQGKTSNGTSTSNGSGSTYLANSGSGTYYIRARDNSSGLWSTGSGSRNITIVNFSAGSINGTQTVCYNGDPSTLGNSTSPSGGNGYTYHWEQKESSSGNWLIIPGNPYSTYNPPAGLTTDTWYRRGVTSCGQTKYTSQVKVTVTGSTLNAGGITGTQSVCYGGNPSILGNTQIASGGDGSYSYQWQYSNNGTSGWTNISGASNTWYTPPAGATADRWYRRRAISCAQTKYTSTVKVTVTGSLLLPGSITASSSICYGETPNAIGNSASASGGSGSYSYQWQYSTNGNDWLDVLGGTGITYQPPSNMTSSRWYRREVSSCTQTKLSNTVLVTVHQEVPEPSNPSVSEDCGGTVLTRGNPPTGITWYWQSTPGGTQTGTSNSASSITLTSGSVHYLRGLDNSTGCWGVSTTINYTVNLSPPQPSAPTITNLCGSTTLTAAPTLQGRTHYWQSSATGVDMTNSEDSIEMTSGTQHFIRVRDDANGCWSPATTINYTIDQVPPQPALPTEVNACGSTTLTASSNPQGMTHYWQSIETGEDTSNSDSSITMSSGNVYYLRLQDDSTGCWGPATTISYTILYPNSNCSSLPEDHNYIYTRTYQEPITTVIDPQRFIQNDTLVQEITFYDGLGRPEQHVSLGQTPARTDLVRHIAYDAYGRTEKEWLPFPASQGNHGYFQPMSGIEVDNFYVQHYGDDIVNAAPNPYSQKLYEDSPMNRVLKQSAPGDAWALNATGEDRSIEFAYMGNEASEVRHYYVTHSLANNTYTPTLQIDASPDDFYPAGTLYKNVTRDENHDGSTTKLHTTEEYTDQRGQVVLKRTYADMDLNGDGDTIGPGETEVPHDTYYVYDDFGNLTYVLPPKVDTSNGVSATELDELCYQYVYDHRNRLVEKKLPGKGWEYIVYNILDQPILTQDANLDAANQWLFTKYDAFGRVAYTGLVSSGSSRNTLQTAADAETDQFESQQVSATNFESGAVAVYYSNDSYPGTNIDKIYTVNYYGSYVDTDGLSVPSSVLGQTTASDNSGLPTVAKVRVLGTTDWITTVSGYDEKSRPIYSASKNNYLSTTDVVESELDFTGRVMETKTTHTKGTNPSIVTTDAFEYDHVGRLEKQTQTLGGQTEVLVENSYDDLGQLVQKKVGGNLQTVDYSYNVRGWLKQINDPNNLGSDLFGFAISYNSLQAQDSGGSSYGTPLYNGNIAEVFWHTANDVASVDNRGYFFEYDALNRLEKGDYIWKSASNSYHSTDNASGVAAFNEELSYDKNGNITKLKRGGLSQSYGYIDDLAYSYFDGGNRLKRVTDSGTDTDPNASDFKDGTNPGDDYGYDANGNLTSDLNKGITSISYNHLNLPTNIVTSSGNISYVYDATGTKLKKTVSGGGSVTEYAGNYVYQASTLQFFSHPEGYVTLDGTGGYDYVYQYKDHLGNVRLSYSDGNGDGDIDVTSDPLTTEIVEENNYYPFGLKHKGYNTGTSPLGNDVAQKFKTYQGQEFTDDLGLDVYEFRWRMSDPLIGRFMQIDPLAEKFGHNSTYAFSENRVVDGFELEGLEYVNANEARIQVMSSGEVHYKIQNMTWLTRNAFRSLNNDPGNWTPGTIGINSQVGQVNFTTGSGNNLPRGRADGPQRTKWYNPYNKDGKTLSGSKKGRNLVGKSNKYGTRSTSASKGLLIFAALDLAARGANAASNFYDNRTTTRHLTILQENAFRDLKNAVQDGLIPQKYLNVHDLSIILNSIFQGDGFGNQELENLGIDIFKWYNIYQPVIQIQEKTAKLNSYWGQDRGLLSGGKRKSLIKWADTPEPDEN